jgi:hypothetical protein
MDSRNALRYDPNGIFINLKKKKATLLTLIDFNPERKHPRP